MSETDPYPHCNATIDLGTRGIHLCYLRAGHSGSHQHSELMVAMVERGALVPNKWDGNLGGGRWVPLKIHQDKLKEQMSNTIAWQMQAEKAADACTLALAERDALRAQLAERDRELELLREVEREARAVFNWASPNHWRGLERAIDRYRAAQADKGES